MGRPGLVPDQPIGDRVCLFKLASEAHKMKVLCNVPWLISGPVCSRMEPTLLDVPFSKMPIEIRFPLFPVRHNLISVAKAASTPLCFDPVTLSMEKCQFVLGSKCLWILLSHLFKDLAQRNRSKISFTLRYVRPVGNWAIWRLNVLSFL